MNGLQGDAHAHDEGRPSAAPGLLCVRDAARGRVSRERPALPAVGRRGRTSEVPADRNAEVQGVREREGSLRSVYEVDRRGRTLRDDGHDVHRRRGHGPGGDRGPLPVSAGGDHAPPPAPPPPPPPGGRPGPEAPEPAPPPLCPGNRTVRSAGAGHPFPHSPGGTSMATNKTPTSLQGPAMF